MEHPPGNREDVEKHLAQQAAMRNAAVSATGTGSDALIQRRLAVYAYSIQRERAAAADDAREGREP